MSSNRLDFDVELIERDLITVILTTVDILPGSQVTSFKDLTDTEFTDLLNQQFARFNSATGKWENVTLDLIVQENSVFNETPTKLSSTQFQTVNTFVGTTLRVFLNGLKERLITVDANNKFSLNEASVLEDIIEVNYIKDA